MRTKVIKEYTLRPSKPLLKVRLEQVADGVEVRVDDWGVLLLRNDGTVDRYENIGEDSSLEIDSKGRIVVKDTGI